MKTIFNKVEILKMKVSCFMECFEKVVLMIEKPKKGGNYAIRR